MSNRRKKKVPGKKGESQKRQDQRYSNIAAHKRQGSILTPPIATIPQLRTVSWLNDRLPELLWGALLIESLGRMEALGAFRAVATILAKASPPPAGDVSLSGLAELPDPVRGEILSALCSHPRAVEALRPLLLFDKLPGRVHWAAALKAEPTAGDWDTVGRAVGLVAFHQSQEATDLRWARLIPLLLLGKLVMPAGSELADELFHYPNKFDQHKVRPLVRSLELHANAIAAGPATEGTASTRTWPQDFWNAGFALTACVPVEIQRQVLPATGTTLERLRDVWRELRLRSAATSATSAADPRHEAAFGIAAYCLSVLEELMRLGNSTGVLGILGLRTILEAFVTLSYLRVKDSGEIWQEYRSYGSGQAKLAFLKLDEQGRVDPAGLPTSINPELLEALASEDLWLEFVNINLGHWDGANLRKLSDESGTKDKYDKFYGWTSAFVHANWTAVRLVGFDLCANPLHRWHRVLRESGLPQDDVLGDAVLLVDGVLELVDALYGPFPHRLLVAPT